MICLWKLEYRAQQRDNSGEDEGVSMLFCVFDYDVKIVIIFDKCNYYSN